MWNVDVVVAQVTQETWNGECLADETWLECNVECGREMCLWNVHAKLMKRGWNVTTTWIPVNFCND